MTGTDPAVEAAQRAWAAFDPTRTERNTTVLLQVAAAREALQPIRDRHRRVYPVFSWADGGLRIYEPCPTCDGKAGVHLCGCWADVDTEYRCATCRDDKGHLVPWPCDTARYAYTSEELP